VTQSSTKRKSRVWASHSRAVRQRLIGLIDYVKRYASKDAADEAGEESDSDEEMSSAGSYASDDDDDEPAGPMEGV